MDLTTATNLHANHARAGERADTQDVEKSLQIAEPQGTVSVSESGKRATTHRRVLSQSLVAYSPDIAAISILIGLIALVSWYRLWSSAAFFDGDVRSFFVPYFTFMGEHVRHLDVPGWMPNTLSGMPFAAEPESGWGYLPAMIPFAFLPPVTAYYIFFISQLVLAAGSTYLLARLMGLGSLGSFTAAAIWTFGPSVAVRGCCTIFSEFAAWLPLALVGIELISRAQQLPARLVWVVVTGVAISQLLTGWLGQGTYYGLLTVGSYFLFRTVIVPPTRDRGVLDRIIGLGLHGTLSFAVGFGLAAGSLWPRLEHVPRTFLGSDDYRSTTACEPNCGRPWYYLLKYVLSELSYWYPYYIGGAVLACAVIGLFELARRRELFYFASLAIVVFMLALNSASIHPVFYLIPEFEGIHKHATLRIFYLLPFPIAILAGAAIDGFNRIVRHAWALGFPLVGRFVWWLAVLAVPVAELEVAPFTRHAFLATWIVVFAGVLLARNWTRLHLPWLNRVERALPLVLVLLILWDPTGRAVIEQLRNPVAANASRELFEAGNASTDSGGAAEFLQATEDAGEPFRYFGYWTPDDGEALPLLFYNLAIPLGLEDIQGYNPGQLQRYKEYFDTFNHRKRNYHSDIVLLSGLFSPLIDLLNVRYIVIPNSGIAGQVRQDLVHLNARYDQVFMNDEVRVLENPNALPRAWIVHDVSQVPSDTALKRLEQGRVDPRQSALVEDAPPVVEPLPAGASDQVTITGYDDDSITVSATAATDGFLVLSEVYDPGWNVRIDGKPVRLYETDYLLRGVAVPKGTHEIVFAYQPKSLEYGIYITLATAWIAVIVVCWAGLWWLRGRRMTRANQRPWQ